MAPIALPSQSVAPFDPNSDVFNKTWWLFFNDLTTSLNSLTSSGPGGSAAPPNGTALIVSGYIDPITDNISLIVQAAPPSPIGTFLGYHFYAEIPDTSTVAPIIPGRTAVGSGAPAGVWTTIDCGKKTYAASTQPWYLSPKTPAGLDPTVNTPCRLYAVPFSAGSEGPLVQANQPNPSLNQTFTLMSLAPPKPGSGTNVTTLTADDGPVGVTVIVEPPDTSTGKMLTPFWASVTNTPAVKGWTYQLVVTLNGADPTAVANQFIVTGLLTQAGPVPAGADGIAAPHTFVLPTPTAVTQGVLWLQAGLVDASGNFQANNIVPGITPSCPFTYGSTIGTLDAAAVILTSIANTMRVVGTLLDLAPLGVTNPYLGPGAVFTINVQGLNITNPLLADLVVQSRNMHGLSITAGNGALAPNSITAASGAIDNLAVSTAAIQLLAADTTIIGNAAVGTGKIINLAVTAAKIGLLEVGDAQIGNVSAAKIIAGTVMATISMTAPTINGGTINGVAIIGVTITGVISITSPIINGVTLTLVSGTTTINIDATNLIKMSDSVSHQFSIITSGFFSGGGVGGSTPFIIGINGANIPSGTAYGVAAHIGFTGTLAAAIAGGYNVYGGIIAP